MLTTIIVLYVLGAIATIRWTVAERGSVIYFVDYAICICIFLFWPIFVSGMILGSMFQILFQK